MAGKEIKTLLLSAGTAFMAGAVAVYQTGGDILTVGILGVLGLGCFYVREIVKDEEQKK